MRLIQGLGYAGLVPFIVLPLSQFWPEVFNPETSLGLFQSYSLIILAFMAGVLWPVLYQQPNTLLPVWVVSLALVGWFSAWLPPQLQLLLLACAFITLRWLEIHQGINARYHPHYRRLRNHLTAVVVLCHLLLAGLL